MTWRHFLVGLGALLIPTDASTQEAVFGPFVGGWDCEELAIEGADPEPLSADDCDVVVSREGFGFHIKSSILMRDPDDDDNLKRQPIDASFAPAGQPGVFAYEPSGGSLLASLFADPSTGNPLEGDRLLWARVDDVSLQVYGLAVDRQGGFELDHYRAQIDGNDLRVHYRLRLENDRVVTVESRLVRAGG